MADPGGNGKITSPAALTGLGSVTISGVAVVMLFNVQTSMSEIEGVVNQHGQELNLIRQSITEVSGSQRHEMKDLQIELLRVQKDIQNVLIEQEDTKRFISDWSAQTDTWDRSDDDARMREHTEYMKAWAQELCRQTHGGQ